jgi:winged helix-turn helix protein
MVILYSMKRPIFVRPFSDAQRETLEAGLRSPDACILRRCQILLKSADDQNAYQIARNLGCNPQTARNAIHILNEEGLQEALRRGSNRPRTVDEGDLRPRGHRGVGHLVKECSRWLKGREPNRPRAAGHNDGTYTNNPNVAEEASSEVLCEPLSRGAGRVKPLLSQGRHSALEFS